MTTGQGSIRGLAFLAPGSFALRERPWPAVGPDETLVAPRFVGICATDVELMEGSHPYFALGVAAYPLQPGHEWSGVVVQSSAGGYPAGTEVVADPEVSCGRPDCEFCTAGRIPWCPDRQEIGCRGGLDGAAAELVSIPTRNLHPVPRGVALRDAVLAEPAATVLGGMHRVGPVVGREVLVIGAGTIGLIAAQVLRAEGARVTVAIRRPNRTGALAGFETVLLRDSASDPLPAAYPLVFCAAGTGAAVRLGLRALANGGQLALLGVPGEPVDGVDVASILHKDATIHGVLNYSTGGPGRFERALAYLAEGVIDGAAIVDTVVPFEEVGRALARAADPTRPRPKVLLAVAA